MENLKLEQGLLDGDTPFFAPVPKANDAHGNPFLTNAGCCCWGDAATFIHIHSIVILEIKKDYSNSILS